MPNALSKGTGATIADSPTPMLAQPKIRANPCSSVALPPFPALPSGLPTNTSTNVFK